MEPGIVPLGGGGGVAMNKNDFATIMISNNK